MNTLQKRLFAFVAVVMLLAATIFASVATTNAQSRNRKSLTEQVRKELVTLPWIGVFDNLAYKVEGDTVTLYGSVVRPTSRRDAERRVAKLNGVSNVVNNIEVLPLSRFDDDVRYAALQNISNTGGLYRYFLGANPSIRIVVNRGNISLEGIVANRGDANLAYIAARQVPGAFSVTNNLIVENERRQ